jgi:DNA-binding NarL/FixJ family response regulator
MQKLNVLIVEDDTLLAKNMATYLTRKGYEVVNTLASGEEAIEQMNDSRAEVILMDIHLKGKMDGVETAKAILKKHNVIVIYITEVDDGDIFRRAKATFPKSYITKPFSMAQLGVSLNLAIDNEREKEGDEVVLKNLHNKYVFLFNQNNCYQKITVEDISIIEAQGAYSKIFLTGAEQPMFVSISSNNIIKKLNSTLLKKVHKSFYINPDKVDAIENRTLKISNKTIPIGTLYYKDTLKYFNIIKR